MRGLRILAGALLVLAGVALLVNQGMNFRTTRRAAHFGSLEISEKQTHHVPALFGALAIVAGVALVMLDKKT